MNDEPNLPPRIKTPKKKKGKRGGGGSRTPIKLNGVKGGGTAHKIVVT